METHVNVLAMPSSAARRPKTHRPSFSSLGKKKALPCIIACDESNTCCGPKSDVARGCHFFCLSAFIVVVVCLLTFCLFLHPYPRFVTIPTPIYFSATVSLHV